MASYINGIHTFIQSLAKKERGVFIEPDQIDEAINRSSFDMHRDEYKVYEMTQKVTDKLSVFKVQVSLTPVSGKVTIPPDYVHLTDIGYQPANAALPEKEIKVVDDARWRFRINRKTAAPSLNYPVCRFLATEIEVRPTALPNVKLTYLKTPATIRWGYTLVSSRPVYSDAGGINGVSVDPEWRRIDHNELIMRACSYLSLTISDADLLQYSESKKPTE